MTTTTSTQLPDPPEFFPDPLTELLRSGTQRVIEQAVEAELAVLLKAYASDKTEAGRARLVRHGHLPEREVIAGIGRDRGEDVEKVWFTSTILPPYLRKATSIEELLPWLYLKVSPPAPFTKRLQPCLARMLQDCPRRRSQGSDLIGRNMTVGNGAIWARVVSSTSGQTAATFGPEWPRKSNACWG